jgi:pterin-4a-carbinolamine dehydratase
VYKQFTIQPIPEKEFINYFEGWRMNEALETLPQWRLYPKEYTKEIETKTYEEASQLVDFLFKI